MAHVTVVANQKGGVGKTTIVVNLAAVTNHALNGDPDQSPVLVVSIDPQASTVWWAERVGEALPFDFVQAHDKPSDLARLKALPYKRIFVDTPGSLENEHLLLKALEQADDVLVPMPPEALSFDPTTRTIEQVIKPRRLPFRVVINNWDPRDGAVDLEQTQEFVAARGWPCTKVVIRRYKLHTRAAAEGQVVTQYPRNRIALLAENDFTRLALELSMPAKAA